MSLYQKLEFQEQITHQNINILPPQQNFMFFSYVNVASFFGGEAILLT